MSYQSKLDQAIQLLEQHNKNASKKIDIEAFIQNLKDAGGTTDEALVEIKWEDLQELGLPKLLAYPVAKVFRKAEASSTKPSIRNITDRRAANLSIEELLENFDPKNPDTSVGRRLSVLSRGQPFLVFASNGGLDIEASCDCLQEIRNNFEPRSTYLLNGIPSRVLRIGEDLGTVIDENPLYPNRMLRGEEQICDQTNRSWAEISPTIRIILYLAITKTHELKISQLKDAHDILDLILGVDSAAAEKAIRTRHPEASLLYDDLKRSNALPNLKIVRKTDSKKQDPFFGHKTF